MLKLCCSLLLIYSSLLGSCFAQNEKIEDLLLEGFYSEDSSSFYFSKAYNLLQNKTDTASYFYFKFFKKYNLKDVDSTRYYANKAIPLLKELGDFNRLRKTYEQLYYQNLGQGEYDKALVEIQKALDCAVTLKDTSFIGLYYADIAVLYHDYGFYEKGIAYGKKAVEILLQPKDKDYSNLINANNAIAINFDDWEKPDSALHYHYKNLNYLPLVDDSLNFGFVFNNIANTNLKIENYAKAKEFLMRSLTINLIIKRDYNLATNYTNLATIAYKQNQNNLAINYFKEANKHAEKSQSIEKIRDVLGGEYSFYKKIKNFKKALEKQEAYYILKDSVFTKERMEKISGLEVQFETLKKEKQISDQQIKIAKQEIKAKKRNNMLTGLIALVLFIIVIGIFIYKQQKLKQQKLIEENRLKDEISQVKIQNELHEERLRISRDLHDNIGSQLTFIISSVDNMKHLFKSADQKLNKKLSDVSGFTRTTITQLRDTIWALNKDEISFEDLKARLFNYIENAKLAQEQTEFVFNSSSTTNVHLNSIEGVNVYRIVQEAINNAMKYAAATNVALTITEINNNLTMSIKDDGIGFNMAEIKLGNGLENMKSRANAIKATFQINSNPKNGTEILLTLNKNTLNAV